MKNLFFLLLLVSVLFSCKKEVENQASAIENRPNIVFIMADDHGYQAISAYGGEISKLAPTPNIDRIADNGVIFNSSYCTNSLCGPSRAVILTGKFSHINGFRQNGEKFDNDQPTLPKMLQEVGYKTAIVGKWHLDGVPQGFDYWDILKDQGHYYNPEFIHPDSAIANKIDTSVVAGYVTDLITDKAINWLKNNKDSGKPFYLMVHHKAPHRNWMAALRHLHKYDSVQFPIPETYFDEHKNQLAAQQQLQTVYKDMYEGHDLKLSKGYGTDELANNPWKNDFDRMTPEQRKTWNEAYRARNDAFYQLDLHGKDLDKWKEQRYLHEYLGTIAAVDEGVGKILDYLEQTGLDKNTLVVYTSDQGFYMGEKGWFDKRFMYEESFRTPLLMQYPKLIKPHSQSDAFIQNVDFAPTVLDLVGAGDYSKEMQGRSYIPLLEGKIDDAHFRDVMYYHYYDFPAFHMVKKHYGIRTKRYKLIHFYDDIDAWEFYDLKNDPEELNNLMENAAYASLIATMKVKLDSIQAVYKVTPKEFERAPKEQVDNAYKMFERLRGTPMK
ncbi:MAG: sulfatase [Flavobacteriaceae bacterium]|nr:sulfatase [Flavobacteriaceae bacterium]